jgi:dihydrofolate reductase
MRSVRGRWSGHGRGRSPHQVGGWPGAYPLGSSTLTSALLENGFADEVPLLVYPILLGTGKRFFVEGTPPRTFELLSTQTTPTGIVLSSYKVAGPLITG